MTTYLPKPGDIAQYTGATGGKPADAATARAERLFNEVPAGELTAALIAHKYQLITRTGDASIALTDELGVDQIYTGFTLVRAGDFRLALRSGDLASLTDNGESEDDVRDALRACGEWLIRVADHAR